MIVISTVISMIIVIVIVIIIITGEFIKLLLTLGDCYKLVLVIVLVVIKGKRKHSGEYNYDNYIIFLIS